MSVQNRLEDSDSFLTDYDVIEVTPEHEESMIADLDTPQQVDIMTSTPKGVL